MTNNYRSQAREKKLQEAFLDRADIMRQLADPEATKDRSENNTYEILMERLKTVEIRIDKLQSGKLAPYIPGTYNVGDFLMVTYKRIVSYGEEREVPENPIKIELVDDFDITTLDEKIKVEDMALVKITTSSHLGQALINKAHTSVRYNTNIGYCEVEIERTV